MASYPTYSDHLIALARAYDRATLAVRASNWHLASLRDDSEFFVEGDQSLSDWTRVRVDLLEDQLPAMASAVNAMIVAESKPWFEIPVADGAEITMPAEIGKLIKDLAQERFHYQDWLKDAIVSGMAESMADHHLILFEGDGYLVPRSIPKSFIEIWWRRYWYRSHPNGYYEMAMVENPAYGWDCYGHER
ncbi:hypothetical protein ACXIVK_28000 [Paraburkholderia caledonica]|jgi:hypothetical protein